MALPFDLEAEMADKEKCLECGAEVEVRVGERRIFGDKWQRVTGGLCEACDFVSVYSIEDFVPESPAITDDMKFMVGAHGRWAFKNLPEDCIHRAENHDDALCQHRNCTCPCEECFMVRTELDPEMDVDDYEEAAPGSLDYEEVRQAVLHSKEPPRRVK